MTYDTGSAVPWIWDETVGGALDRTAALFPDHDALVFPGLPLRWSWSELKHQVDRTAAALVALDVQMGEHIGIWSMNVPEWVVTQLAAARIGAVLVNVNPAYRLHELQDALAMADVATLVVGSPFKGSNFVSMVETLCPEIAVASSQDWYASRFPRLLRVVALGERPGPGWRTWADLEQGPHVSLSELDARARAVRPSDVHNIQFTSGTTGLPKGAMLTHRNILMNAYYTGERLCYKATDRVCVPVPFYHCFGCVLGTMACVVHGSAVVVPAPSFDGRATLSAIATERCTAVYGVPTMFVSQLEHPDFEQFDLTGLRTGIMSGAPCPLPLLEKVVNRMGIREICIGYGQTEASPLITLTSVDDPVEVRVGTIGHPLPGLEVKLIGPGSQGEVPTGETGELCVRGHCVMAGYYNNPQATASAIDGDGWLHTGDLARRRDDDNFRIAGRSRELIIRGGENIYPAEVEEYLHRHPDVAEVAVAGVPDARFGEAVAAWIVLKSSASVQPEELQCFCRDQIAHFKIPKYIMIVESLPRTVTGKIRKHVLRDQAIEDLGLKAAAQIETA
jgi:fatty-acyl-CoA synthase